jgi:SAM-dependent methyltransferase
MSSNDQAMRETWEASFEEQIARHAYNTAPVEALVRNASYYLRDRYEGQDLSGLHFGELGCGAGPNLVWLAEKGIEVSGVDIAPTALELCRRNLDQTGHAGKLRDLVEASVTDVPLPDASFDGLFESCVFQHLTREDRRRAFEEVARLLKPGGLFVGYMLDAGHSIYQRKQSEELADDPGTLILEDGSSNIHLSNIGLAHFFRAEEFTELLPGFSVVDPCLTTYYLPRDEAGKRGYDEYLQSMWTVYAIK